MKYFIEVKEVLSNIDSIYAHIQGFGAYGPETLIEHTILCQSYYKKIVESRDLEFVFKRIALELFEDDLSQNLLDLFFEITYNVVTFHDFGKINPEFQLLKMKNKVADDIFPGLSGSNHSNLSAAIFYDYFRHKIKQEKLKASESNFLRQIVLVCSYVISRHHSNLNDFDLYTSKFGEHGDIYNIYNEVYEESYRNINFIGFKFATENLTPVMKAGINFKNHKQFRNPKNSRTLFIYARVMFSLLIASDFYATTEYMNGFISKDFDTCENNMIKDLTNSYKNSKLYKIVKDYSKKREKDIENTNDINILRSEIFLESEKELEKHKDKSIFFLEAPTGSGKTNTAFNLSLRLAGERTNKLIFVYPYNNLIEQSKNVFKDILKDSKFEERITVVNSLSEIVLNERLGENEGNNEYNEKNEYVKALLDRQFLNYPLILTTHVNFFDTLFSCKKLDVANLFQYANSVIVLDEIQSYRNKIWAEIIQFLDTYAELLNIKIIIMSATLPSLNDFLIEDSLKENKVVKLLPDTEKYFTNKLFKNRVELDFSLLKQDIDLNTLKDHVITSSNKANKIMIEFIKKKTAYEFYELLSIEYIDHNVELITGDDNIFERNRILDLVKLSDEKIILVATQVIEAGVDIDMDIGYKDISILDAEEQMLGRINRSCKKFGKAYFFNYDDAEKIYSEDVRTNKELTLLNESVQDLLLHKDFNRYYSSVINILRTNYNLRLSEEGLESFYNDKVANLKFSEVEKRMKLIDNVYYKQKVFINSSISVGGEELVGKNVWENYKNLLLDNKMEFAEKQIKLSRLKSKLNHFIYEVYATDKLEYNDILGELLFLEDGEKYLNNGKLILEAFKGQPELFY